MPQVYEFESGYEDKWARGTGALMKSSITKRSINLYGHKTSVSLEDAFWSNLKEIAHAQEATLSELITKIDQTRQGGESLLGTPPVRTRTRSPC